MGPSPADVSHGSNTSTNSDSPGDSLDLLSILSLPLTQASEQLLKLPASTMERIRTNLWDILGTVGRKDEFLSLQRILASKQDLNLDTLSGLPLPLGKILVAVRTGIQAFLHPSVQMSQQHLAEIFLQRRCKNMACQSPLPAGGCSCTTCSRVGFCNLCMCVVCKKFDFETNTCRWIGCDFCLHWCHSECAIHMGHISTVNSTRPQGPNGRRPVDPPLSSAIGREETAFCCPSCGHCSDLLGFVKDVFEMCAEQWDAKGTKQELECVRLMFGASNSVKGAELLKFVSKLLADLEKGVDHRTVLQSFRSFLSSEAVPSLGRETLAGASHAVPDVAAGPSCATHLKGAGIRGDKQGSMQLAGAHGEMCLPSEADTSRTRRSADGVTAIRDRTDGNVEIIFLDEDGAIDALAACDRELEQKRKELEAIEEEKQKNERQLQELQNVSESREADAKRLEAEAEEARKEVQVLNHIIEVKRRSAHRDYEIKRGGLMLEEAEAKRRKILEALDRMRSRGAAVAQDSPAAR